MFDIPVVSDIDYQWIRNILHVFYVVNRIDIVLVKYGNPFFKDSCSWRGRLGPKDSELVNIRKVNGSISKDQNYWYCLWSEQSN